MRALLCVLALALGLTIVHAPQARADTLICEGDSQTAARLAVTDDQTWCALVAGRLGWSHVNFAVGGSKSADVLERLPTDLASAGSCVAVMIGANDAWIDPSVYNSLAGSPPEWTAPQAPPAVPLADYDANLVSIVNAIRAAGKTPLLVTPWSMWSTAELVQFPFYIHQMQAVGTRLGVPVIDAFHIQPDLYWNLHNSGLADLEADYQHPSADGHAHIAALFQQERYSDACAYHP